MCTGVDGRITQYRKVAALLKKVEHHRYIRTRLTEKISIILALPPIVSEFHRSIYRRWPNSGSFWYLPGGSVPPNIQRILTLVKQITDIQSKQVYGCRADLHFLSGWAESTSKSFRLGLLFESCNYWITGYGSYIRCIHKTGNNTKSSHLYSEFTRLTKNSTDLYNKLLGSAIFRVQRHPRILSFYKNYNFNLYSLIF